MNNVVNKRQERLKVWEWFLQKLCNPRTWNLVIKIGWIAVRFIRLLIELMQLFHG